MREKTFNVLLYTGYTQKNGALLPQLNTNYDDYILQLDGTPPPRIEKETTTFSLGHPISRI
jgi:hypothetical protein